MIDVNVHVEEAASVRELRGLRELRELRELRDLAQKENQMCSVIRGVHTDDSVGP